MKIHIGAKTYKVKRRRMKQLGRQYRDYCLINVNPKIQCPQQLRATLLHEVFHAISDEYMHEWTEKQTERYSTQILELLKRNPKLVAFLMEES